jgi:ubiquinone/menaquinone biosynthesis C-methylase UbiE
MDHQDHVALLRDGLSGEAGAWADLGSGGGAFTLALAELIGPAGEIYSIDKDRDALRRQEQTMRQRFPDLRVHYHFADFTHPPDLPPLDGIVMANSLHFIVDKDAQLRRVLQSLRPGGRLILVEYEAARGNLWVPYPLEFRTFETLARRAGFSGVRLLHIRPSRFLHAIYSALAVKSVS